MLEEKLKVAGKTFEVHLWKKIADGKLIKICQEEQGGLQFGMYSSYPGQEAEDILIPMVRNHHSIVCQKEVRESRVCSTHCCMAVIEYLLHQCLFPDT